MPRLTVLLAIAFLPVLIAPNAHARSNADLNVSSRSFTSQAAQIRSDLSGSDKYAEISASDRNTVLSLLARIESVLGPDKHADALSGEDRVAVFNDQEQINGILTGAREDSRMICRREITTGSHRKQQICMTNAERERQRATQTETMLKYQQTRTISNKPGGEP